MNEPLALIIEDDRDTAGFLAEAAKQAGYAPEMIHDGAAARARLAESVPAVVLLDLNLPHVKGTELLAAIQSDSRLDSTRVIIITGHGEMATVPELDRVLVLIKPVNYNQLRDLMVRYRP